MSRKRLRWADAGEAAVPLGFRSWHKRVMTGLEQRLEAQDDAADGQADQG